VRTGIAVAGACVLGFASLHAGDAELSVRVRLTVAGDVPTAVRMALVGEASTIWQRAGVRLVWAPPTGAAAPGLRVLVVHRPAPAPEGEWPVGELVMATAQTPGGTVPVPIAFVSIESSWQILATANLPPEPQKLTHRRLGVVLGRAVAHEIGHYLLATPTHAASGLMRARIAAADFADLREGGFFLDRRASRWLLDDAGLAGARPHASTGFHYTPR